MKYIKPTASAVFLLFLMAGSLWADWYVNFPAQGGGGRSRPFKTRAEAQAFCQNQTGWVCDDSDITGSDTGGDGGGVYIPPTGNTPNQVIGNAVGNAIGQGILDAIGGGNKPQNDNVNNDQAEQQAEQQRLAQEKQAQEQADQEKKERIDSKLKRLDGTTGGGEPGLKRLDDDADEDDDTQPIHKSAGILPKLKRLDTNDKPDPPVRIDESGWAQISLQNNTNQTVNFYIDKQSIGPVMSHGVRPDQVKPGLFHNLEARSNDGTILFARPGVRIQKGQIYDWIIPGE